LILAAAGLALAFGVTPASADPLVIVPHSASATLSIDDSGFSRLHTSDGATGTIKLTLPKCAGAPSVTSPPYEPGRSTLGTVWLIQATAQKIELVPGKDDEFLLNGSGIGANDELDLDPGDFAIVVCGVAGKVYVESGGGADGGEVN